MQYYAIGDTYLQERFSIEYADLESFKWGVLPLLFAFGATFITISIILLNKCNFGNSAQSVSWYGIVWYSIDY